MNRCAEETDQRAVVHLYTRDIPLLETIFQV